MYKKHGYSRHPLYHIWNLIKYRCYNIFDRAVPDNRPKNFIS